MGVCWATRHPILSAHDQAGATLHRRALDKHEVRGLRESLPERWRRTDSVKPFDFVYVIWLIVSRTYSGMRASHETAHRNTLNTRALSASLVHFLGPTKWSKGPVGAPSLRGSSRQLQTSFRSMLVAAFAQSPHARGRRMFGRRSLAARFTAEAVIHRFSHDQSFSKPSSDFAVWVGRVASHGHGPCGLRVAPQGA